jgi:hypothetical protein
LESHYRRMVEYLSSDPELSQRLGLNGAPRRSVLWRVFRILPRPLFRRSNDLALLLFRKGWADLAAEFSAQMRRG